MCWVGAEGGGLETEAEDGAWLGWVNGQGTGDEGDDDEGDGDGDVEGVCEGEDTDKGAGSV